MSVTCQKDFTITINQIAYYAYYKLDEATLSTALIDQVSGYTLNAGSWHMVSTPGKIGTAFDLGNGTNTQFVNGPDAHWVFHNSFSLRVWIMINPTFGVYHLFGTGVGDQWWITYIAGSGFIEFTVETTGGSVWVDTDPLTPGVWHHLVFWFEQGVGLGVRVDNVATNLSPTTDPIDDTMSATETLYLNNSHFIASGNAIDEIAIWDHKLTDAEITADWNNGNGVTYP